MSLNVNNISKFKFSMTTRAFEMFKKRKKE